MYDKIKNQSLKDPKKVEWIGDSLDVLKTFPEDVQDVMGKSLWIAQCGDKAKNAKPLHGFPGSSVLEIFDKFNGDEYRVFYFTKNEIPIYVLHSFKKKSTKGISTPKRHISIAKERLRTAILLAEEITSARKEK